MAISIDSIFDRVSEAFDKAAEKNYDDADRAEQLAELFDDPALRGQINGVLASGALVGLTVFNRLKDIIVKDADDETEEPAEEPEPSGTEQDFAAGGKLPESVKQQVDEIFARLREAREQSQRNTQNPYGGFTF